MKKLSKAVLALSSALSLFALASCADAIVDDGSHIKAYTGGQGGVSGGAAPFSMYNDVFDVQIWESTFTANVTDSLAVTIGTVGWFGGVLCSKGDGSGPTYDMSAVKKMSFEGKADGATKVRFFNSDKDAQAHSDHIDAALTEEWQEFEWERTGCSATDFPSLDLMVIAMVGKQVMFSTLKTLNFLMQAGTR